MSRPSRGRPRGGRFGLGRLSLAITLSAIWFLSLRPAVDPDYGWHIQNGRHVFDGSVFSGRDLYSWTASGYWIVHEWLTEAAMSMVHDSLGPPANSVLAALLGAFAFFLVAMRLRERGFGWLGTLLTIVLAFFGSIMSVGVRPQILELVYLAALGLILDRWITSLMSYRQFLAVIAFGATLWTNTHGSFPLMSAILALAALGMLFATDTRWLRLSGAAIVAAICALANPWGWRIYEFATQSMMSKPTLALIEEWRRPDLLSGSLIPFDLAIVLAGIAAGIVLLKRTTGPREREEITARVLIYDVTVAVGLLYLAINSGRHVMLFGVGAAPLIAWTIDRASNRIRLLRGVRGPVVLSEDIDSPQAYLINRLAAALVATALAVAGWNAVNPAAQASAMMARYPVGLVGELARLNHPPARLLNEYSWGGFLIGRGVTPVFIDGRSELYGDKQLLRYSAITRVIPGWRSTLDSLGVTLVLMPPQSQLAAALEKSGWRMLARDSAGSLLQRP